MEHSPTDLNQLGAWARVRYDVCPKGARLRWKEIQVTLSRAMWTDALLTDADLRDYFLPRQ